jgi:uncharacterized protein (DUF4415 family)
LAQIFSQQNSNRIYNLNVAITYDSAKNERNIRERGLSFDRAADFDFGSAYFFTEIRKGEQRRVAVGYLDKRLHLLCYVPQPDGIGSSVFARPMQGRQRNMAKRKPLTNAEGEVRELTAEDAAYAVPFSALPEAEQKMLQSLRKRGPQKSPRKVPVSIRLSPDVAEGLRATGEGWQRRADDALRSWLRENGRRQARG